MIMTLAAIVVVCCSFSLGFLCGASWKALKLQAEINGVWGNQNSDRIKALPPDWQGTFCDCCGKRAAVSECFAFGIETYACDECRGMS